MVLINKYCNDYLFILLSAGRNTQSGKRSRRTKCQCGLPSSSSPAVTSAPTIVLVRIHWARVKAHLGFMVRFL